MALLRVSLTILPLLAWVAYKVLRYYRYDQFKAFPQLKPDLVWGHMKAANEYIVKSGKGRHEDYAFHRISQDLGSPPVLLLDMRPLFYPICIINSHAIMEQVAKPSKIFRYSVFKSPSVKWLAPIIGPTSIISREGEEWRHLRKRFNPGFAPAHLVTLLPAILDKTERFTIRLEALAESGEVFELGELCTSLTFDIIGAVVLDEDFKAQLPKEQQSSIVREYRALTASFDNLAPFSMPFSKKAREQKRLGIAVDTSIKAVISKKHAQLQRGEREDGRSVLELSLQDGEELTPELLQETADQVKSFLFAGHDTTSILLQWTFYILSIYPRVLSALTEELDSIFGPSTSPDSVAEQLLERGEEALRQMSYTSAVIKEALRLYPPAASARMAPKGSGYTIRNPETGEDLCLDGMVIYGNHYNIQRDPTVYGDDATDFVPERWLGNTDTSMEKEYGNETESSSASHVKPTPTSGDIPASAWRPFERGPRNCIGQELANLEARVILACAVRRFTFHKVGVGEVVLGENGEPNLDKKGRFETMGVMYNRRQVTAKPFDGMMMKVSINERGRG